MTKNSKKEATFGIVPEKLNEENYVYWKTCLKNYLVGNGLWDVVSGKEPEPEKKNEVQHSEWKRKNALALHAIILSSGLHYSVFKGARVSAHDVWHVLAEKSKKRKPCLILDHDEEGPALEDNGTREYLRYEPLRRAVEEGNWDFVQNFIEQNPNAIGAGVSSHRDTALHIAVLNGHIKIAEELVKKMEPADLELINEYGHTALSLAAISGSTHLAQLMVHKNKNLVRIANEHEDGQLPVIIAALYRKKHMVRYLYRVTPKDEFSPEKGENGATLLNCLITAEFYDVASMLLKRYPQLGVTPDHSGNYTLKMLVHKPFAFYSTSKLAFWEKWIYSCITVHSPWGSQSGHYDVEHMDIRESSRNHIIDIHESSDEQDVVEAGRSQNLIHQVFVLLRKLGWIILSVVPDYKHIYHKKLVHDEARHLLSCIFSEVRKMSKRELEKMDIDNIIYDAIKHGIVEFVVEIIKYKPEIIWKKDKIGRTIFAHAIVLRQEKIFSLIHCLGTKKRIMAHRHDIFRNNFLHLAAKLSPPSQLERVSGAALQMQRELQWFKEVESIVQPKLKEEANENNKTPEAVFSDEHKQLAKEAEKWMKNISGSSIIVSTLIAAVMFTTAFTIPGGSDSTTGLPVMLDTQRTVFLIFMVSTVLSMFTSTTSVLLLLGVLTARFAEEDYLKSLPAKLILGLTCLFFSIVTMMTSFGSALILILHDKLHWVTLPVIILSAIPVVIFSFLQFPILIEVIYRTYVPHVFHKPPQNILRYSD